MSSRWFHNCGAAEAEHVLLTDSVDGSFLVRPSSKPGDFTISVRYRGEVNHIKIINDGDSFCLAGSPESFATLQALVQNYMDNLKSIKEKRGGFIELLYPIRSHDPTSERWFHGRLSSVEAERLLLAKGRQGSYLVRESQTQPGQYVLAVRCKGTVHQIMIKQTSGVFEIAGAPFQKMNSLHELIEHLVKYPSLRDVSDQSSIVLIQPYDSTSFIASSIKDRMAVLRKVNESGITGFREEFEQLIHFDENDGVYTMNDGCHEDNKSKNRYKNIIPYDHSRVHLNGDPEEDYINANFIDPELDSMNTRYIATQGPMESTNSDFWNMVFQENCNIIVMLTNETENNKVKCAKYWPDFGETMKFEKLNVENLLENSTTNFIRRELKVSSLEKGNKKAPVIVYQYHYTEWPDHDVPNDAGSILGLLSEVHTKQMRNKQDPPIVIHCSAGIGRTGTVMAIDILMHLLDEQGFDSEIDIQKTCQILRTQRSGMIQTEKQYQLIYQSIENYMDSVNSRQAKKIDQDHSKATSSYGNIDFSSHPHNKNLKEHSSDGESSSPAEGSLSHAQSYSPKTKKKEKDEASSSPGLRRQTAPALKFKKPWKASNSKWI